MTPSKACVAARGSFVLLTLCLVCPPAYCALDAIGLASTNPLPAGYSFSYDRDQWSDAFSVFQLSAAEQFGVINSTLAASDDPRLRPLTRLDTAWKFAAPVLHTPTLVGDTVSSSGFWDEPVRMGGVQIGTLQPAPPAVVAAPSMLLAPDILANPAAVNVASSHIIDHVNTAAQLQTQALASAGQMDYSLEMGRVREDFELRSSSYGAMLTSGTYRYGINAATTVDGQFAQIGAQQSVLGVGLLEALGALGQVSARVANSHDADNSGWLARVGYDFSYDELNLALRTHIQSTGYQSVSDITAVEPLRQRTLASAGWNLGSLGKVSVASATQTYVDDTRRDVLALSHAMPLAGGGTVSTAAAYSPGQLGNSALLLTFTYPFNYWSGPSRQLSTDMDLNLDKTITDALNQTRLPVSGHVAAGGIVLQ